MPIFELDEGRPRLVQPMQPLAGSFAQECDSLLTHHLTAIAGEPLFPVRSRTGAPEHASLPALLALDATGRPVIVEIVQVVDDDAVVSALRHAGAAARMTTTDLTRAYHADPSRFGVEFAAFREQVAFGAQTSRREGVRLILLCSEVAAEASDTLGFLRGPGRHVDILQVGVVRGGDDRRLIDVSPLAQHEGSRRAVEPTALRLVRASESTFASAMAYEPERRALPPNPSRPWADHASSGELRAVPSAPPMPRPAPASALPLAPTTPRTTSTQPTAVVPEPAAPAATGSSVSTSYVPTSLPPTTSGPTTSVASGATSPSIAAPTNSAPTATASTNPPPAPPTPPTHELVEPAPVNRAPKQALPPHSPAGLVDVPHPQLATLAKQRRAMTTLVWYRERRNQRVVAMLRNDGLIQLAAGQVFADPSHAASAAIGADSGVDGWRAWRIGDGGPTLGEATGFTTS
ncbi:restriction system modified-DNA reader domain-containing protein [Cellulomonas rhizosphaerae]|uniref:RAMA domain-containing protein n=1 Tax=Cellulomonas rhizosphaerae TaxID=2293719 RepID=A0A413RMW1_9CELL|nr:hypothetical protein [Cellulomonas rhizosphaerae]RHA42699.1 hypothetical protein D1825_06860 [Cellulomonas rhizosphaerae]